MKRTLHVTSLKNSTIEPGSTQLPCVTFTSDSAEQNPRGRSSQCSNDITYYQIDEDVLFTSVVDNEMLFGKVLVDGPDVLDDTLPLQLGTLNATDMYEEEMEATRPSTSSVGPHTSPRAPTPSTDNTYINIHRSNIQREMIAMFMDPSILDAPTEGAIYG